MKKSKISALFLAGAIALTMTACQTEDRTGNGSEKAAETEISGNETETPESNSSQIPEEEDVAYEADPATYYVQVYETILDKYYQAISEQWDQQQIVEAGLSPLLTYCFTYCNDGKMLDKIGYSFLDIDNDGHCELLIQAVNGDEFLNNMIFEMYTLKDGKPAQVFCGQERDRYYLSDMEEGAYIISEYASSGALQSKWNYFILEGDELTLEQGILYDAESDENDPWSFAYDDETADSRLDEQMARDIIKSYETRQFLPEPFSFGLYK